MNGFYNGSDINAGILDAFARVTGQSLFVNDYKEHRFAYVSPHSLFLCGYTREEVMAMGHSFFKKVVPKEDMQILAEVDEKGCELFYSLSPDERKNSVLSYDYRLIQPGNKPVMVNQKDTPLFLNEHGEIRFALCSISISTAYEPGNVTVRTGDMVRHYVYSSENAEWNKADKVRLTYREQEVLRSAVRGFTNEEISKSLYIDIGTVKFHKMNIFSKLKVKNINEAITYANNCQLL